MRKSDVTNEKMKPCPEPFDFFDGDSVQPFFRVLLFGLLIAVGQTCAAADEKASVREAGGSKVLGWFDSVYMQVGMGTHWGDSDDYQSTPVLVGVEGSHDDRHLVGVSLFNNSFDQFSQYFYYGYKWRLPFISESVQFKLTGGLIHGYVDEYEDKLAYNHNGWAPVLIPSLGWKRDKLGVDLAILGNSGVMLLIGYDIWNR